jgi:hypothetical protein
MFGAGRIASSHPKVLLMGPLEIHAGLLSGVFPLPYKRCSACAVLKPLTAFYRHDRNKTDGRRADCKACFKKSRIARQAGKQGSAHRQPGNGSTP